MYLRFDHGGFQEDILCAIEDAGFDGVLMQDAGFMGYPGQSYVVFDPAQAEIDRA